MRVVAGRYKGKNLLSPKDDRVRPTTTRIKETLFNVIQGYVRDSVVLDLFAGSGALGIECISRDAQEVTFVDNNKDSIMLVKSNLDGIKGNYKVVGADYMSSLRSASASDKQFDIIFLDPPYATEYGEMAITTIMALDLLKDDGIIVFEHGSEKVYTLDDNRYKQRTKNMGTITAEFITKKSVALMPGSFDPFTKGHEAVLDEALCKFDEVWVACLVNPDKQYMFTPAQRLAIVNRVCENKKGAHALYSDKYAVEVAKEVGASSLVRGIRGAQDMAYERDMADYNREHGFDTIFIEPGIFENVSSTLARQQIAIGDYSSLPSYCILLVKSSEFADLK